MNIIVSLMISICLLSILHAQYKATKHYHIMINEALVGSGEEESSMEKNIARIGKWIVWAIVVVVCIQGGMGKFNQRILLWMIVGYLLAYYASEYVAHRDWIMQKEGIRYSRQLNMIGWENIIRYRWFEQDDETILRVSFKGKGLVTRKCDLNIPKQKKRYVKQLLEKQVPWIKA